MKVNWLYYFVSFSLFITIALATDCTDIKNELKNTSYYEYYDELITCTENEEGKVISL